MVRWGYADGFRTRGNPKFSSFLFVGTLGVIGDTPCLKIASREEHTRESRTATGYFLFGMELKAQLLWAK